MMTKRLLIRRRSLLAAPALLLSMHTAMGAFDVLGTSSFPGNFPGGPKNGVGFFNAPGYVGNASGSGLTQWNGTFGGMAAFAAAQPGGQIASNQTISFQDFVAPTNFSLI